MEMHRHEFVMKSYIASCEGILNRNCEEQRREKGIHVALKLNRLAMLSNTLST